MANYQNHINRRKSSGLDSLYRNVLETTNPWNEIGRIFVYQQMDEHDLVDVVAYFWIHTHGVSTNLMPDGPSQRNYNHKWNHGTWLAVRGQVQTMFDNEKAMTELTNDVRQRYADSVMFEIVFQQQALKTAMRKGIEDAAMRKGFVAINRDMIGFDISQAALGSGGFYIPPGSNAELPFLANKATDLPMGATGIAAKKHAIVGRPTPLPQGLPKIKGAFYQSEVRMLIGASPEFNSSYVDETLTILFADGAACQACHTAWTRGPTTLAALKLKEPGNFGTWKSTPTGNVVSIGGRAQAFKRLDQFSGGRIGLTINATLTTTSGRNSDNDHLGSTDYLQLRPDGRFNLLNDRAERQTRPNLMGHYSITGDFRIIFNYDDGYAETLGFAVSPDDPNFVVIDGTAYYVSKEKD